VKGRSPWINQTISVAPSNPECNVPLQQLTSGLPVILELAASTIGLAPAIKASSLCQDQERLRMGKSGIKKIPVWHIERRPWHAED